MKVITLSAYNALHPDKRSVWTSERTDQPNWEAERHLYMGKRTMLDYDPKNGTVLLIEGLSLKIIDDRKPSPGPWQLQQLHVNNRGYDGWSTYCMRDSANHCLAVIGDVDRATAPYNEKNAMVMAAAPELLTMLQRILDGVLCLPELPPTLCQLDIEQAMLAIQKATGGSGF